EAGASEEAVVRAAERSPRPAPVVARLPDREAATDRAGSADVYDTTPPASRALLAQSRSERAAGSYAAAAASVERALRIDPNNALLWLELAQIRLEERDPAQAYTMARQAQSLAGGSAD